MWKIPGDVGPRTVNQDAAVWNYSGVGLGCCARSSGIRIRCRQGRWGHRRGMHSRHCCAPDGDLVEWEGQGSDKAGAAAADCPGFKLGEVGYLGPSGFDLFFCSFDGRGVEEGGGCGANTDCYCFDSRIR
jgi:hypothetical protein